MAKLSIPMTQKKTTKGTVVYASDNPQDFITTVYVEKEAFDGIETPKRITLSVDW